MKLALATSPHVKHVAVLASDFEPSTRLMYTFAPVGLLSLVSVVREAALPVESALYDTNRRIISGAFPLDQDFYAAVAEDVLTSDPDIVGFMTECDSYHHVLQIATQLKTKRPATTIVLGGPHASAVARPTLQRIAAIDAIVVGEGERSFVDLLDALSSGDKRPVPGTVRRIGTQVIDGGPAAMVGALDELPIPAYELYPADEGEVVFVEVGRGCPFQCTFCSTAPYWNRRHRVKSPARIVAEIELVQRLYGSQRVHFTHDLFTTDRRWVRAVCEALIDAHVPVRWTCSARTDTVDRELLALMAQAGCNAIYFGIESGSQRMLRAIHKDIPIEHSLNTLALCRDVGITPNAGFIVGLPGEDAASLSDTFEAYDAALRLDTKPTHLFGYCPFADSSLYPQLRELECSGHFVDLPLGRSTDTANRNLIASDAELYGAYYRPRLSDMPVDVRALMEGIDEFSPLVEANLYPALVLAHLSGGMYPLYLAWARSIATKNGARGAAPYRRGYGSPADFAGFLADSLRAVPSAPLAAVAAADALRTHLGVLQRYPLASTTTMATHRSLPLGSDRSGPASDIEIGLSTPLVRRDVVATLRSQFDVSSVLRGEPTEPAASPVNLVWQVGDDGAGIRLLAVDDLVASLLDQLDESPTTIGELILRQAAASNVDVGRPLFDAQLALASAAIAAREGLVRA
jgi:radical SAM superfamily enzyme YgiQ (UPF0313 family)